MPRALPWGTLGDPRPSGAVHLDEGEDVFFRQLVRILGLLGVVHKDTIPPLPEEPAIVADAAKGNEKEIRGWGHRPARPPHNPGNSDAGDGMLVRDAR